MLPYYIANFPILFDEPQPNAPTLRRPRTRRPCFWAADLGRETLAGHAYHRPKDVRAWLRGAGYTEILVSTDAADLAHIVGDLREAWKAGRRDGLIDSAKFDLWSPEM